jgi:hypothetical protein
MAEGRRKGRNTSIIHLTMSAARHARNSGLQPEIDMLAIGPDCMVGDLVTVSVKDTEATFTIIRRRWIAGADTQLEITLDYPVAGRK